MFTIENVLGVVGLIGVVEVFSFIIREYKTESFRNSVTDYIIQYAN